MEEACRDYLMEHGWLEGFTCSLPLNHAGSHRAEGTGIYEDNVGVDTEGRKYTWVYEWKYAE